VLLPNADYAADGGPLPLAECYKLCRDVARDHSKTFYLSSLFLAPPKRRAIWAIYAYCRTADDIVDRLAAGRPDRLAALDEHETKLLAAVAGEADEPIFIALADAMSRFAIPTEAALNLLRGGRMDVTVSRYETFDELLRYCDLVAATVGLLTAPVLGYERPEALEYGVQLGRAMQLTNILRDVGEDARMGRIYLPLAELRRFGCTEAGIFAGTIDDAWIGLMRFQIERARELYAAAEPGIALLEPDARYTVRLALDLYRKILDAIEANGYDVFTKRAFVPLRDKLTAAALGVFPISRLRT
jgi:phytoene synthase